MAIVMEFAKVWLWNFDKLTSLIECHPLCYTCNGGSENNCIICKLAFRSKCVYECPTHYTAIDRVCLGRLQFMIFHLTIIFNPSIECHKTCLDCFATTSFSCVSCPDELVFYQNRCLVVCPPKLYRDGKFCVPCVYPCLTCSSKTICQSCVSDYYLNQKTFECVIAENCPERTFAHYDSQICQYCDKACLSCTGFSNYDCKECDFENAYVRVSRQCKILTCSDRQYILIDYLGRRAGCRNCDKKCGRCDGPGPTKCFDCSTGNFVTGTLTDSHVSCGPCEEWNKAYQQMTGDISKCEGISFFLFHLQTWILEICGDGIHAGQLECDDGNNANGDGCSSDCKVEFGFRCDQKKNSPDVCYDILPPEVKLTVRKGNSLELKFSEPVYLFAYSNYF